MGFDPARGFTPHPGNAGGGGAIHQSSVDAADVDRSGRRDVLERAESSAPHLFEDRTRPGIELGHALPFGSLRSLRACHERGLGVS